MIVTKSVPNSMNVCGFILIISLSSYYFSARASDTDEETLCVYMKSCVLPCRFTPGSDLRIQWIKTEEEWLIVHSFHHGQNQDVDQHRKYRGRTSLFEEEMNRGNASLLLKEITLEDQGRFLCWANSDVTYVNMKVFAPVLEVHVDSINGHLICQAHDVYPEPSLNWTMNPEPPAEPQTSVNPSETGLFSVYSSVPLPDLPDEYTCTVSTEHSTKSRTYERTAPENPNLHYLWILPVIVVAVVCFLVYRLKKKKNISLPRTPPPSPDEELGSRVPLKSDGNSETQPSENGHANGLDKETPVSNSAQQETSEERTG